MSQIKFVYFGGEPLAVPVAEKLAQAGLLPSLVVCNPDRPSGRGQQLTPPPIKVWADNNRIPVFQPASLKDSTALKTITDQTWDLFIVVAYNHIMPEWLINLPAHQTLNVHPSLLPKLRGPSPIRTAILEDRREDIGVSIMQMDNLMDHGPIVAQEPWPISNDNWPTAGTELDAKLAQLGGKLLATTIPKWVAGRIKPQAQSHTDATYTKKFNKESGRLEIDPHQLPTGTVAKKMLLKIRAFDGWPGTFFMYQGKRIKIKEAEIDRNGGLRLITIIPEGKSPTPAARYF